MHCCISMPGERNRLLVSLSHTHLPSWQQRKVASKILTSVHADWVSRVSLFMLSVQSFSVACLVCNTLSSCCALCSSQLQQNKSVVQFGISLLSVVVTVFSKQNFHVSSTSFTDEVKLNTEMKKPPISKTYFWCD